MTHMVLIHGFNDRSAGEGNIDKCRPYFEQLGYEVDTDQADYGFFSYWAVRFLKRPAVIRIVQAINALPEDTDVVIMCYSNGANFARKALPHLNREVRVIFCSAALNRKVKFHENLSKGWNFIIKNDLPVWLASFIPFHPWGRMGAVGYCRKDETRIMNIDYSDVASGHGGMFKDSVIGLFTQQVHRLLGGSNE
jgi:hypothetical protein